MAKSRRQDREKRPDIFKQWQAGDWKDEHTLKDRRRLTPKRHVKKDLEVSLEAFDVVGWGRVLEVHRRSTVVAIENAEVEEYARCRLAPFLDLSDYSAVTVGDWVQVSKLKQGGEEFITDIRPRVSKLSRPGPDDREHREQILAVNIDQIVVVSSVLQPAFNAGLIDRYLVAAEYSNIPLVLVLNKMDLADELPEELEDFKAIADKVLPVSVVSGEGLEDLREVLKDRFSVFTGSSGVGKSSLVNKLIPGLDIRIGDVREKDGKGRHTTTSSTLLELPWGGAVIDTPGIRGMGLWDLKPSDLATVFPAFEPWFGHCKFSNCSHLHEPECAIIDAIEEGELSVARFHSYERIMMTLEARK